MILKKCRVCNSDKLIKVIDLKKQPLANNLVTNSNKKIKLYPLKIFFCKNCKNSQLSVVVNNKILFNNYIYKSSVSSTLSKHFIKSANKYIKRFKLNKNSYIMDIGSNDGIGLLPFKEKNIKNLYGVEPAKNLSTITKKLNIETYNSFLNSKIARKNSNKFDLITASNVFAHVDKIKSLALNIKKMLKKNGIFIVEVQYLPRMLIDGSFDNIYHEHVNYWCLGSLDYFFNMNKLKIFDAEYINTHGGSIRVYIKKKDNFQQPINKRLKDIFIFENKIGIGSKNLFKNFKKKIEERKIKLKKKISKLYKKNYNLVGYGAPAKASTLINFFNISKYINYIKDDNPLKNGMFIPNTNIKILNKFKKNKIDAILVFAWNYFDEIKKKNNKISKKFIKVF